VDKTDDLQRVPQHSLEKVSKKYNDTLAENHGLSATKWISWFHC